MVSNTQGNKPSQPPHDSSHEPSLDTLALAEWLAERRATGDIPQLSALIAALPDAAGDLADATMLDALVAEADADDFQAGGEGLSEDAKDAQPSTLSPGAQRAVADICGAGGADALAMVAETPALYAYEAPMETGAGEAGGLLALAHEQGLDTTGLAARIMLSPDVLRWLDRIKLPPDLQPDALTFHLVGALGVPRERVREALTRGNVVTGTDTYEDTGIDADALDLAVVLTTSTSLTPVQRAYWAAQLAGQQ